MKPSTSRPQKLSFSPKFIGPSIASIPLSESHSRALSKRKNAAVLSSITSKNPIPPVFCLFAADLILSINAATRPIVFPSSSLRIHLMASPCSKEWFFRGSKIDSIIESSGQTQQGSPLYSRFGKSWKSCLSSFVSTSTAFIAKKSGYYLL